MSKSKSSGTRYGKYKADAARRGFKFTLTKAQFDKLTSQPCKFCGNFSGVGPDERPYNGVDRVNNNKGYIKDNCVPCCWICNDQKGIQDEDDFLEHIKAIYEYQKRKK